jgi:hypothetical protein
MCTAPSVVLVCFWGREALFQEETAKVALGCMVTADVSLFE